MRAAPRCTTTRRFRVDNERGERKGGRLFAERKISSLFLRSRIRRDASVDRRETIAPAVIGVKSRQIGVAGVGGCDSRRRGMIVLRQRDDNGNSAHS